MSALEDQQQWYIEEISVKDGVDSAVSVCSVSSAGKSEKADEASDSTNIYLGTPKLDTGKSKEGDLAPSASVLLSSSETLPSRSWECKTIDSRSSTHSPSPRGGCSWTKVGAKYILFGGADAVQAHFNDVYCFDSNTGKWEEMVAGGTSPSPRSSHSAVAIGNSLVVYGGINGNDGVTFNDLFELETGTMKWTHLHCAKLPPRNSHTVVLQGDSMIIIGGASPEGPTDEVYTIDFSDRLSLSCQRVSCQPSNENAGRTQAGSCTEVPVGREMHSACIYDPKTTGGGRSTIFLMGGRSSDGVLRDLFSLSTESWTWTRLKDAPYPRCAHSATFIGDAGIMAIHGGWDGGTSVANDLHLYDVNSGEWMTPRISPPSSSRFAHAACAWGEKSLLVFGGVNPGEDLSDVVLLTF